MSIKSKIQSLITAANATTGETDATLTDAVQTLVDGYGGITPTGNINITDTNVTDVTNYATAQVVDADLVAANIKKDVNILGVVGSFEGGGDALIAVTADAGALLTCGTQTYQLGVAETTHMFTVPIGTYTLTASLGGQTRTKTLIVDRLWSYSVVLTFSLIPQEYQELDYITSSGEQYFDTGVVVDDKTFCVETSLAIPVYVSGEHNFVSTWIAAAKYWNFYVNGTLLRIHYSVSFSTQILSLGQFYSVAFGADENGLYGFAGKIFATIDGVNYSSQKTLLDSNQTTIKMFARGDYTAPGIVSMKTTKIYIGGTLERNLIPCYRISDNVVGMYDLVNSVFYSSATQKGFIAGTEV